MRALRCRLLPLAFFSASVLGFPGQGFLSCPLGNKCTTFNGHLLAQEPGTKGKAVKDGAKGGAKKKARPRGLDPFNRPEGSIVDQTARYYVWYDDKGWHLRTTAKGARDFEGTIRVKDARIKSCVSIGLMEGKQKGRPDLWKVNGSRSELTFQFRTGAKSDGFDLIVEGEEGQIEFDLSIGGKKNPKAIFVGRGLRHPGENPFSLPAVPKKDK
jgi:hypothetical protein